MRQSQDIIPISIRGLHHHIALYADDVLIFMQNPSTSATRLLRVIEELGNLSGFNINWPKSAFLPLNDAAKSAILPANIPVVRI